MSSWMEEARVSTALGMEEIGLTHLLPVNDIIQPTAPIDESDISRVEETLVVKSELIRLGIIQVALKNRRPSHAELGPNIKRSHIPPLIVHKLDIKIRQRHAHAPRRVVGRIAQPRRHAARLRHAPDLGQRFAAQQLLHARLRVLVQRRGAHLADSRGFQAEALAERTVDRHDHDGRHHGHVRDAVLFVRPEPSFQVEARHHVGLFAGSQRRCVCRGRTGGVEHWQGDEADGLVGPRRRLVQQSVLGDEVVMTEHGRLRQASGARGEEHGGGRILARFEVVESHPVLLAVLEEIRPLGPTNAGLNASR